MGGCCFCIPNPLKTLTTPPREPGAIQAASGIAAEDIQDYVIDKKDGKSPPDGGRAAKQRADELSKWGGEVAMAEPEPEPEPEPGPAPVAEARPGWYCTVDNDEWEDITTACGVMSTEHREYFEWLKLKHKMGNNQQFKQDPDAVFFYSPLTMKNGKRKLKRFHHTGSGA